MQLHPRFRLVQIPYVDIIRRTLTIHGVLLHHAVQSVHPALEETGNIDQSTCARV